MVADKQEPSSLSGQRFGESFKQCNIIHRARLGVVRFGVGRRLHLLLRALHHLLLKERVQSVPDQVVELAALYWRAGKEFLGPVQRMGGVVESKTALVHRGNGIGQDVLHVIIAELEDNACGIVGAPHLVVSAYLLR